MNTHPISKKGWLRKLGGIVKTWHRRWIVLNGDVLFYFTREDDQKSLGSILLPGNRVFAHSYNPGNPDKYIFEVEPDKNLKNSTSSSPHEVTLFCCECESDRQEWIRAIRKVIYGPNGGAIFGQCLKETMLYEHNSGCGRKVPYITEACVNFLEKHGLETEGVYRLAGRIVLIKELQESFDTGVAINLEDSEADVHTVASLLKLYLRELPDSIIPSEYFQKFMGIAYEAVDKHKNQDEEFIPRLTDAVNILEVDNYNILKYLCRHLYKVSQHSDVNKMTLANLSMVFGPNIIRHEDENPEILRATADLNQKLALILIKHSDIIFANDRSMESHLLDLPVTIECPTPVLQPVTTSNNAPIETSDIMCHFTDTPSTTPPEPLPRTLSNKNKNKAENSAESESKPVPPLRLTKSNSSRHHRRQRLLERNNNFSDSLSSPESVKSPLFPAFGDETPGGSGGVASPGGVRFNWEHFTSSNMSTAAASTTAAAIAAGATATAAATNAVCNNNNNNNNSTTEKHTTIDEEIKERGGEGKNSTEVDKLKKDLSRMKLLYEEKVSETESLKEKLKNQTHAKEMTINKIVELQEALNKYKIKYGELK
ncbi:rho GTPase-activating protein 24-like [Argonauta hians]